MPRRPFEPPTPRRRPLTWMGALAAVVGGQAGLMLLLSWSAPEPTPPPTPIILVEMSRLPPPTPPSPPAPDPEPSLADDMSSEAAPAPDQAQAPEPTPPTPAAALRPPRLAPPPQVETLAAAPSIGAPGLPLIGGARLAGALRAGGGGAGTGTGGGAGQGSGAGGACDMAARLQAALRDDPAIRRAIAATLASRDAAGQAVLVWNGDWLQSPGEEGKGLAGVRQAVAVEVGFAPRACRDEPVRGLVVLALDASPTGPKVALGSGAWRWRDLLGL